MDAALIVAIISGVVALLSAALSGWTQLQVAKLEREGRVEERRSQAKVVLDRYRGPLLDAAWQLGDRVDNIRNRAFFDYLSEASGREQDARLSTLFRFANYLGWREFLRTEVQLLRFDNEQDTRSTAQFLNDVTWVLGSDKLDGRWAMLWGDEQRGIGELMTERPSDASFIVRGHAAFYRDYDKTFASWMDRFAVDLFSSAAKQSNRLRLLQWALYGLVRQLDEEGAYGGGWIERSAAEIGAPAAQGTMTQHDRQLREHLAALKPSIASLPGLLRDSAHLHQARSRCLRCCPRVAAMALGPPPYRARSGHVAVAFPLPLASDPSWNLVPVRMLLRGPGLMPAPSRRCCCRGCSRLPSSGFGLSPDLSGYRLAAEVRVWG